MEHECQKGTCDFCNVEVECEYWHMVTCHNKPLLWDKTREEAEAELNHHLGHLWDTIKASLRGDEQSPLLGTNGRDLYLLSR